jgi:cell division initiation protein
MAFGPRTIEEVEFKQVAFRGYKIDEVDEFLDMVADEVDRLQKANRALEDKVAKLSEKEKTVTDMEQTLRDTLITAQRAAEDVVRAAKEKANAILQDSELESKRIIGEAEQRTKTAKAQLETIKADILTIKDAIRKAITDQLQQLDEAYPKNLADIVPIKPAYTMENTREFNFRDAKDAALAGDLDETLEERLPQYGNEVVR